MRVIAGQFRHRRLTAPPGMATRPSSDRLRETLFNVLTPRVPGSVFADLFAGSGAVGIEAASRGAAAVIFVESQAAALRALRANLAALAIGNATVMALPAARALGPLAALPAVAARGGCDLVFLDPPYAQTAATLRLLAALGARPGALRNDATVVVESRSGEDWPGSVGALRRGRSVRCGSSALVFFRTGDG